MPEQKQITVESVAGGLAKLIREVRNLQKEVATLTSAVKGFTDHNPIKRWGRSLPSDAGGSDLARAETREPFSAIQKARYEYGNTPNLEIPTRTLFAIAKELDGALRDIRAARNDIEAIADNSDLRDSFKEWQEEQKN